MKEESDLSSVFLTPPNISRRETSSAPPALQLDPETLFAFQTNYWRVFSDIRCDENYANFYRTYGDKSLPAPLEEASFIKRDEYEEEELMKRMLSERFQMGDGTPYAARVARQLQYEQQQQQQQQQHHHQQQYIQQQQQLQQQRYMHGNHPHSQFPFQNGDHYHHNPMQGIPIPNGGGVARNELAYRAHGNGMALKNEPGWSQSIQNRLGSLSSDDFNIEEVFLPNIDSDSEFSSSTEDLGAISSPTPTRLNPPMLLTDRYFAVAEAAAQKPHQHFSNIWDAERGAGHVGQKLPSVPQVKSNFGPGPIQQVPTLKTTPVGPPQISPRSVNAIAPPSIVAQQISPRNMNGVIGVQPPAISPRAAQQGMAMPPIQPMPVAPVATRAIDMARFYQQQQQQQQQQEERSQSTSPQPPQAQPQQQPTTNGTAKKRVSPPPSPRGTPSPSPRSVSPGVSPRPQPCRYFLQGYCSRGDRCNFSHDAPQQEDGPYGDQIVPKQEPTPEKADSKAAKARGRNSNKADTSNAGARYTTIEQVIGQIYPLCKDQHGCRFLQKKLEEQNPKIVEIIFNEVYDHMVVLMTDPFGNYLCQKLLEYCTEQQRTAIIEKVATELVSISKNMHGTRAVQKMIEYINSPVQINLIRNALRSSVVGLIQDLNGNHVIQRCLNKLSPEDNQFIYDAVAGHCVEVATHRHGCCVLQRCIDHASDSQKVQLFQEISLNALTLVQDPYGNYVVQYVLELPFPDLVNGLIRRFLGHLVTLSTQKFSSNVMEKCLHTAEGQTRSDMVLELAEGDALGLLLQDPFANYVIQTALGVADPAAHDKLADAIKPHMPALRNTPYGKRIQNKLMKDSPDKRQLEL